MEQRFLYRNYKTITIKNHNTIDTVLSINGIPLFAFELKDQFKGQNVDDAMRQWKEDRDGMSALCHHFQDPEV